MIFDPQIEVICDRCDCSTFITPNFVYGDYSGRNGHYDCSDSAIEKQLHSEGWLCSEGEHVCDSCLAK